MDVRILENPSWKAQHETSRKRFNVEDWGGCRHQKRREKPECKIGILERLIEGQDKVVRGAKVRVGQSVLERAIQHLYPIELSYDATMTRPRPIELRADVPELKPRRDAAAIAKCRIQDMAEDNRDWSAEYIHISIVIKWSEQITI